MVELIEFSHIWLCYIYANRTILYVCEFIEYVIFFLQLMIFLFVILFNSYSIFEKYSIFAFQN